MDIKATIAALRKRFSGGEYQPAEGTMAATPEAEAISKKLPAPVMPRKAIEKKRQQLKQLDEQTKED